MSSVDICDWLHGGPLIESARITIEQLREDKAALVAALKPFADADLTAPVVRDTFGFDVLRARAAIAKATGSAA